MILFPTFVSELKIIQGQTGMLTEIVIIPLKFQMTVEK